jgi:gamma-glutamyltranspeptidase / glutathione hydrolase
MINGCYPFINFEIICCMLKNLFLLLLVFASCKSERSIVGTNRTVDPYQYSITKEGNYKNGAVACAHPLAAKVGVEILKQGGNAIDAAIATQLALAVVYPGAGNIGGGGFLVARLNDGAAFTIDFRETAPAKATLDMYLDEKGNVRGTLSLNGHLAAGVPGTVAGLFASMKYAKLPFNKLIQPAIDFARNGFVITKLEADKMNDRQQEFKSYNTVAPVFVKNKWKAGDTLVQTDLANTLERIRDKGQDGFYKGETARLIIEEMQRGKGIITYEDLANYTAKERQPLMFTYKGNSIITMPPPSSGGITLWQMLKMVEDRPLSTYGFESVKSVQLMTEVERRAFADRATFLGDPDFVKVPIEQMTNEGYLRGRMVDYDSTKAGSSKETKAGVIESTQTTHISIVDKDGNAVAVTTTLNNTFGSKTIVGGAGFVLNDEMDDFSTKPGVPNLYGAVGGQANAIAPNKRMLSSMTPTIVIRDNKPIMVVGTPGGTTIPTSIFQMIVDAIDFKMNAADAVNKPRFHHQWLPDEIQVEKGFSADVAEQLRRMGYQVKPYKVAGYESVIGRVEMIVITDGKIQAVGDNRGDDSVDGY